MQRQALNWVQSKAALARIQELCDVEEKAHIRIWESCLGSEASIHCCSTPPLSGHQLQAGQLGSDAALAMHFCTILTSNQSARFLLFLLRIFDLCNLSVYSADAWSSARLAYCVLHSRTYSPSPVAYGHTQSNLLHQRPRRWQQFP